MDKENLKKEDAENLESTVDKSEETTFEDLSDDITNKVDKLELELEEWKSAYTRKLADFQNFSKRKENELQEMKKYASENLISQILNHVDNLERAIVASKETHDFESLIEGVELTLKGFHEMLNQEGVSEIEAEGKEFDPYEHQAMMTDVDTSKENNEVLQVFQKGYTLKGKVIRPAMVKVNKK